MTDIFYSTQQGQLEFIKKCELLVGKDPASFIKGLNLLYASCRDNAGNCLISFESVQILNSIIPPRLHKKQLEVIKAAIQVLANEANIKIEDTINEYSTG